MTPLAAASSGGTAETTCRDTSAQLLAPHPSRPDRVRGGDVSGHKGGILLGSLRPAHPEGSRREDHPSQSIQRSRRLGSSRRNHSAPQR